MCKLFFLLLCLILYSNIGFSELTNCTVGECVPLRQCPELKTYLENNVETIQSPFLKQSRRYRIKKPLHCYSNMTNQYKFCCAKNWSLLVDKQTLCGQNNGLNKLDRENYSLSPLHDIPWKAVLVSNNSAFCSGSLINKRYILTSAGCVQDYLNDFTSLQVRLGDYDLATDTDCDIWNYANDEDERECYPEDLKTFSVEKIIPNPNYVKEDMINDIALIRLKNEAIFKEEVIGPICLPFVYDNRKLPMKADLHGWGISQSKTANLTVLRRMYVDQVENVECQRKYKNRQINEKQLCIEPKSKKIDSCIEDNGGILSSYSFITKRYIQIAVASFSNDGCKLNLPSVYTKVEPYMEWILESLEA